MELSELKRERLEDGYWILETDTGNGYWILDARNGYWIWDIGYLMMIAG